MKKIGSFILTLIIFLSFMPGVLAMPSGNGNESALPSGGLIWDCWEVIEANLLKCSPLESALPSYVNLKHLFPTPGNQGNLNSCVGWAVAYALLSHQEEVRRGWGLHTDEHIFSPYFVWNQLNRGQNGPISIGGAMGLLVDQGVATLASFPQIAGDYRTQPTPEQRAEAMQFRIASWHTIRGIDNIRRRLADTDGVVIAIRVFPDFINLSPSNPVFDTVSGIPGDGHAVTLIGYCDAKEAFKFINSWGTQWGLGGYGWISYELMNDTRVNQHGAAVGFIMEPRDNAYWERFFEFTVSNDEATIIDYTGLGGEIVIPDTLGGYPVTAIGNRAFRNNTSLTGVVIPDSIITIGNEAFQNNISLISVTIGNGVMTIGNQAFQNCASLTNVVIGDSVTTIGNRAFQNNTSLTEVIISDSVNSIEWDAFAGAGLTNITFPNSVTSIGGGAFRNTLLTNVVIPDNITYIGSRAFLTSTLAGITVDENNPNYASIDGVLFNRSLTTLIQYPTSRAGSYIIPYGVTVIESFAFYRSEFLTGITIPDSVISIGMWAFAHCLDLTGVAIPDSVTSVGRFAFSNNISLTYAIIGDGLTYISGYMFAYSPFLNNVIIGNGVTAIGERAFFGCRFLRRITVPESVTFIGWQAFHHNAGDMWFPDYRPLPFLVIYCYENSFAHNYAISNAIPFVLLAKNYTAKIVSIEEYNGYIIVTLDITGTPSGYVFFSAFDKNGAFIGLSARQIIRKSAAEYRFNISQIPEGTDMIRVMIWECLTKMNPLDISQLHSYAFGY